MTSKLEELIWNGSARYETRAFSIQQYNLIEVPADEFIIITGYDFQPANVVNDAGGGAANGYQGLQRIEIISGGSYNSFFHKMSGQTRFIAGTNTSDIQSSAKPFHSVRDLYIACKKDIGIQLSVAPDMTGQNSGAFDATLAPQVFKSSTANMQEFQTYSALPGNVSVLNNSKYSEAYASGAVNGAAGTNFTFRDTTATQHVYNREGLDLYTRDVGMGNVWTLVVHFVRVLNKPPGTLI
jgi:hypothetical protein